MPKFRILQLEMKFKVILSIFLMKFGNILLYKQAKKSGRLISDRRTNAEDVT